MNIEKSLSIPGWMSKQELEYLAEKASESYSIVEIGSWVGRSTTCLALHTLGSVFCVDTWEGAMIHEAGSKLDPVLFEEFSRNVSGLPVIPIVSDSLSAAKHFFGAGIKFDMIFIDADHTESGITADIFAWSKLVAYGGILCGHDYGHFQWPDVKVVVDTCFPGAKIVDTIWAVRIQ